MFTPNQTPNRLRRNILATAIGMPMLQFTATALAQNQRRATPAQSEGPFYPVNLPQDSDFDLLRNGALAYTSGQPAWVEGVVSDLQGKPLRGAQVEIWQCDESGHYKHPRAGSGADPAFQGFGRVTVGDDGQYRFRTIRPARYSGRTPHIHVKVKLGGRELLTTQLYVKDDPGNTRDFLWRSLGDDSARAALSVAFTPSSDGLRAIFPIVVAV